MSLVEWLLRTVLVEMVHSKVPAQVAFGIVVQTTGVAGIVVAVVITAAVAASSCSNS